MRVLVTGATSDTGRRLCGRLLEAGHQVVCFTRGRRPIPEGTEAVRGVLPEPGQPWGESGEAMARALEGCALVHCCTHIRFAPAVVERALEAGVVRTVCVSSARRFTRWPSENERRVIAAEEELLRRPEGWVAFRSTMIYGGGSDKNIARLVRSVRRWPLVALPGGGRARIQPLFVEDLVEALLAADHAPGAHGRIINVAGPEPLTLREVVKTIARVLGRRRLIVPVPLALARIAASLGGSRSRDRIRRMGEDRVLDIAEARELLGFAPRSFEEGLRSMLETAH